MPILITFLISSLLVLASVHIVSLEFSLYWKYPLLDIPVHMLGGVCVALGIGTLTFFGVRNHPIQSCVRYLLVVMFIGVCWELFEVWAGIPVTEDGFVFDVVLDLLMDLIGGMIGYGMVKRITTL